MALANTLPPPRPLRLPAERQLLRPGHADAVYDLDFAGGGANAAALTAAGFTFARTGAAWDHSGTSYATGVPRIVVGSGLLIEGARTNLYTHNDTLAAQTITPASGSFTVSAWGTGSVVLSGLSSATVDAGSSTTMTGDASTTLTITPSGTPGALIVNAEAAAFKSSPIVTAGSSVTRNAESCTVTRAAGTFSQGSMVITALAANASSGGTSQYLWIVDDNSTANRIGFNRAATTSIPSLFAVAGSATQANITTAAVSDGTILRAAFRWAANDLALSVNGATVAIDRVITVPATTIERLGTGAGANSYAYMFIRRVRRYSRLLTDAELAAASS